MKDDQTRIKELENEIGELQLTAQVFKSSEEQRTLELKHEQEGRQRDKEAWEKAYNLLKTQNERIENEKRGIEEEKDEIEKERDRLKNVTVKNLKTDKEHWKAQADEWKARAEALEPSWLYKQAERLGIVQFKNTVVNASFVVGIIVILYGVSVLWKHVIKPTYRNFQPDPKEPTSEPTPPTPVYTVPQPQPQTLIADKKLEPTPQGTVVQPEPLKEKEQVISEPQPTKPNETIQDKSPEVKESNSMVSNEKEPKPVNKP